MNKKNKWLYILIFTVLAIAVLLHTFLDNDLWYILAEGKYIVQNGLYKTDVLSIHRGLDIVVQNWGSAAIFYLIFDYFGELGLITLILGCNVAICVLLYKICMVLSDNKKVLSLTLMFLCDIVLSLVYIVTRPQIISYILILSLVYILELYVNKNNKKVLWLIPVISLLQINLHASLWLMLFLFIIPYLIDGIKSKKIPFHGYNVLPIVWPTLVALVVGLINPYGYKAITFIFSSYTNKTMHLMINELSPFSFDISFCKIIFFITLAAFLIIAIFRKGNIRVRHLCLISGTMLLGFMSIKGFSHFILVLFFPFAYFFKDYSFKNIKIKKGLSTAFEYISMFLAIGSLAFMFCLYARDSKHITLASGTSDAINVLKLLANPEISSVYASFNNGGCVEYAGFKSYIDPRAEVFIKKNNHKENILDEFYNLQLGKIDPNLFIEKYNFTHILTDFTDILFNAIPDNYIVIYESADYGVRLIARKDLFTAEQVKEIERQYALSKK